MARDFNGSTDRLDFLSGINAASLSAATMSMWVRRDAAGAGNEYLYHTTNASNGFGLLFFIESAGENPQLTIVRATTNQHRAFTSTLVDGVWANLIITWSGGTAATSISAYVNNSSLTAVAGAVDGSGAIGTTDRHMLGGRGQDDARNYDGKMAEVGFWNVALNSAQRQMLANGMSPALVAPTNLVTYNPLVRNLEDRRTGVSGTADGTTVYEHPRVIRRSADILRFPPVAIGGTHNLEGSATGVATGSGALSLSVPLAGAGIAAATASGAVSVAIPLAGDAQAVSTGGGALTLGITLQGSALAEALASAALSLGVSLAGGAAGEASGSGDLSTSGTVDLAGGAAAESTGLGTITLNISLAGAAIAEAAASGELTIDGAVDLAGNAMAEAVGSGALSVAIPLEGFAASVATSGGVLSLVVPLEGVAASASTATGGLDVAVTLSASALATAAATGDLSLSINLSGAAVALATGAGLLASDGSLTGTPGWEILRQAREWQIARQAREWRVAA